MDQLPQHSLSMKISSHTKVEFINTLLEVLLEDMQLKLLDMELKMDKIIGLL